MNIALVGHGAIARYAMDRLTARGHRIVALILRPERIAQMRGRGPDGVLPVSSAADLPEGIDHVIDCAGHSGLAAHGPGLLKAGLDLTTVAAGALADRALHDALGRAAQAGGAQLCIASGAIGALDCLRAARVGGLRSVRYVGRKPPRGWLGSPAERRLDLERMDGPARTHFRGTARQAALDYPRNANVAAAVALSGLGFEETEVELVADPQVARNVHEIRAEGDFGVFDFRIEGAPLPENPKSSALAAMSVVGAVERHHATIVF